MKFQLKKLKSGRWGICLIQKNKEDVVYDSYSNHNKSSAEIRLKKYNDKEYWKKTDYVSPREPDPNRFKKKSKWRKK